MGTNRTGCVSKSSLEFLVNCLMISHPLSLSSPTEDKGNLMAAGRTFLLKKENTA